MESKRKDERGINSIYSLGNLLNKWIDEHRSGQKNFLKMRQELANHPIESVGQKLRAMMPWIGQKELVDKDKN